MFKRNPDLAFALPRWSLLNLLVAFSGSLFGQDGSLDPSFKSPLFPGGIPRWAIEANGKVLYSTADDGIHFKIGRLTSQGSPDASVDIGTGPLSVTAPVDFGSIHIPGATNPAAINVILPLADGKILVGGSFNFFHGVARKLLVRLNSDGTVDEAFQGPNFDGTDVFCAAVGPGGRIYVGGKLGSVDGAARNIGLVRLTPDGRLDASFADGTISFGASVSEFSIQPDGKVLIVAGYVNPPAQVTLQLFRLKADGGLDSSFLQGAGTPAVPASLRHCLMSNGQILLSGGTGVYNGATVNRHLFRLNADGTVDVSYPGVTLGLVNTSGLIGGFLRAPDSTIYFYGAFDKVNGQALTGLGRLRADGPLDLSFVPQIPAQPLLLALQADGKLLASHLVIAPQVGFVISRLGAASPPAVGPRIGQISLLQGGKVRIGVSESASQVIVQSSANLKDWSNLDTNSVESGVVQFSDPSLESVGRQFYRLQDL